ncbi:MAG: hypothetical protein HGA44_16150, partial [Cellulomonadaceae bacterium]|nr:hypothetical protein [Cellulomonadaceae bacterium]
MSTTRRLSVLGAAALLVLTGCGGSAEPASGSGTAPSMPTEVATGSASPGATPDPTPTPSPIDPHPALDQLVVSTAGLGPLAIGVPPEVNPGAAMITFDPDACTGDLLGDATGDPGRWFASGYDLDASAHGGTAPPFFVGVDPVLGVSWIDILGASPRTAEGLGVGSLLSDVQTACPDLQGPYEGGISRSWWVTDAHGTLVFETELDGALEGTATGPERVELMRVLAPGLDPAFTTAHSD